MEDFYERKINGSGELEIFTRKTYPVCKGRDEKRNSCEDFISGGFCDTWDGEFTYGCPYKKGGG